jgi:hypothetical protein
VSMTEDSVELVHAMPQMGPMTVEGARSAMEQYREMCSALLTSDDMQQVGDRSFVKRSGFTKLAAAYGVSTEIKSLDYERGDDGDIKVAHAIVHATHPSGRSAEGDGHCSSTEKRFRRGAEKIEHDLPATAVTRATNRAVSNLVAYGSVSAEEAEAGSGGGQRDSAGGFPSWAEPMNDIPGVAHNLVRVLQALGAKDPAGTASNIGDAVFRQADGSFPFIAARVVGLLAEYVPVEMPKDEVDGDATERPS